MQCSGLTSVLLRCTGPLPRTRVCVSNLLRHTRPAWELVAVLDSGAEGLAEYFEGLRDGTPVHVEIVRAGLRRDAPGRLRPGLEACCGDSIALLDDGTIVTDCWLDQLIALLMADPEIAMVAPMSCGAVASQNVVSPAPLGLEDVSYFASEWRKQNLGQWMYTSQLDRFCLLGKRAPLEAVWNRVGEIHELPAVVHSSGQRLAVARDLFVFRLPGETSSASNAKQHTDLDAWAERLAPKGPVIEGIGPRVGGGPRAIGAPTPDVSLTMIAKNEEANLADCLRSVEGLFDELIVVDTGSTDQTAAIARAMGAQVVEFPWIDHFAAARNAGLAAAKGRYAFWLDADDRVDRENYERLSCLFEQLGSEEAAYVMKQVSPSGDTTQTSTVVDHVRLFPNWPEVRWGYRVHEQIVPALRRAGVPIRWTDISIQHVGYMDERARLAKVERNRRILEKELKERPGDPFVLYNLGSIAIERDDPRLALGYLRASLARAVPRDSLTAKICGMIARAYQSLDQPLAALAACQVGRELDPDDAMLLFREAVLRRQLGDTPGAKAKWRMLLGRRPAERFSSALSGVFGHLTRRNLAALAEEAGDRAEATKLWQEVLAECPNDPAALAGLERLKISVGAEDRSRS